jgi:hypothetical protein
LALSRLEEEDQVLAIKNDDSTNKKHIIFPHYGCRQELFDQAIQNHYRQHQHHQRTPNFLFCLTQSRNGEPNHSK